MEALRPGDEADLAAMVFEASSERRPLIVEGAGSRRRVGGNPPADARALDLCAFSGVIEYEPTELVLTAGAATPLIEIEKLLAAQGQMLAFEPAFHASLCGSPGASPTLGGAMGSNAGGSRRLAAGAARDHFLGFRAVSGRGEAFKAGSKVVKNVTGFDLCKLMAGSWGTLAVLTEVSVKVLPAPACTATLVLQGLAADAACAAMAAALGSPAPITGAAYVPGPLARRTLAGAGVLSLTLLRLEGWEPTVLARADALGAYLRDYGSIERLDSQPSALLWREIGEVRPLTPLDAPLWRISAPANQAPSIVNALPEASWIMDWAGGLIWFSGLTPPQLGPDAHYRYWGGQAIEGPGFTQTSIMVRELSQRLKLAFDPADVLNRGRLGPLGEKGAN